MGISIWQLLITLLIVVVLFGTKKLRNIGSDLGAAIKNFRQAMRDGETEQASPDSLAHTSPGQVTQDNKNRVVEEHSVNKQLDKT